MRQLLTSLVVLGAFTNPAVASTLPNFATTPGTGPDKWASAWLLRRHENPVPVTLLNPTDQLPQSLTLFDTSGAPYDRTGSSTTYSALLAAFDIGDSTAQRLGELVHEIEIDAWRTQVSLASQVLEQGFRGMQLAYGRDVVTQECYVQFFDRAASAIESGTLVSTAPDDLRPDAGCLQIGDAGGNPQSDGKAVSTLPLSALLRRIGDGEQVVFVDTRERWEYDEGHIPGAINLQLRDVDKGTVDHHALNEADLVIAYCVKDFRGFEVAKALRVHDVPAAIITPHGMRGWVAAGLPVAGEEHLLEQDGISAVRQLARESSEKESAR